MSLAGLYEHVRETLPLLGIDANVVWGKRELAKSGVNQGTGRANRVVFVPGADGGALGAYGPPAKQSHNAPNGARGPRGLWDWAVIARVYVWTYDSSEAENEFAQWKALVELHDSVIEAIHKYTTGFYKISAPKDPSAIVERRFGMEVMFQVEIQQPVLPGNKVGPVKPITGIGSMYLGESDEAVS